MGSQYRSYKHYNDAVRKFFEDEKTTAYNIYKAHAAVYPARSIDFDVDLEAYRLTQRFIQCLQDAGALQFYIGIGDKIYNTHYEKYGSITSIQVGETVYIDGTPVVYFKVHYENTSLRQDHKIVERYLFNDQKHKTKERDYLIFKSYVGVNGDDANRGAEIIKLGYDLADMIDITNRMVSFCGAIPEHDPDWRDLFENIKFKIRNLYNLYFIGYKIDDTIEKSMVASVIDKSVYKKLDNELKISLLDIYERNTSYMAVPAHNKKSKVHVVFSMENMKEI